ncbi:MAG: metal-dependent hydrolase [Pirellulales bacterium]
MAGFKTHITVSTTLGVAYGTTAALAYGAPLPACALAGGLCSVSGMLPDLDSGPGVPLRESTAFAAAVVPMLLVDRFERLHMPPETIVLVGGILYLLIRFGAGRLLTQFTVHRGMFHSIPAMAIVGEFAYLICAHENPWMRLFNATAVMLGFASHLVLDEIWSIDLRHFRLKSSFGTAVKLWGDCWWANLATYANAIVLALLIAEDPTMPQPIVPEKQPTAVAEQPAESWRPWKRIVK